MAAYNNIKAWHFADSFFYDPVNAFPSDVGQIGKYLHVVGGSGWTIGYYQIVQVFPAFATGVDGDQNMLQLNAPLPASADAVGGQADIVNSPGMTAAVLSVGEIALNTVALSWSAASGGSAPLVTHLFRGENRFGSLLTDLGNVSSVSVFNDSTAVRGKTYDYYLVTTDAASQTATSNKVLGYLADQVPIILGTLGDSNYAVGVSGRTTDAALQMAAFLKSTNGLRSVIQNNQSVGGKGIHDFQPGSSGYIALAAGWNGAAVTIGFIIMGYNDTNYGLTKSQYKTEMLAVCNALFADVSTLQKIVLGYCFGKGQDGTSSPDASNQYILLYHSAQDEIVAEDTQKRILAGNKSLFRFIGANPNLQNIDSNIHLNDAGCVQVGRINAEGIAAALYGSAASGSGINGTGILGML